jgi:hypothetical protein
MSKMLGSDPLDFIDTLVNQMNAAGITDPEAQQNKLFKIFGRQTTQRMMFDLMRNRGQIRGERDRTLKALGAGAGYDAANDGDVVQNLNDLTASWHKLLEAVAGPDATGEINIIKSLGAVLDTLSGTFRKFDVQNLQALVGSFASLGTLLAVGGPLALAFGPVGWFVGGIAALGVAAITFPWKSIFADLTSGIKSLGDWLQSLLEKVRGLLGIGAAGVESGGTVLPPVVVTPGGSDDFGGMAPGATPQSYRGRTFGGARLLPATYSRGITGPRIPSAAASPMGNASIGGGIHDAASFDRTFSGTALQGHWGDVEAAAKANGISPNLMAAIMVHETGKGSNLNYNNVAGLMDPATHMSTKQHFASITDGINAAGRTIGKNWKRAGGDIDRMGSIYAPPGAANDPHHLNGGWASGVRRFLGDPAVKDSIPVPGNVLTGAASLLQSGASTGELQRFMSAQGYPKSGAWCGEFTASVVHSVGGTPPRGAAVASNWLNYGQHVDPANVQPGDIAVRKFSRFGGMAVPGQTGSHIGIVSGVGNGGFDLLAGNQHAPIVHHGFGQYEFRRGGIPPAADKSTTVHTNVHLDGKVVARNTAKHLSNDLNRVSKGSRVPDYTAIRPLEI